MYWLNDAQRATKFVTMFLLMAMQSSYYCYPGVQTGWSSFHLGIVQFHIRHIRSIPWMIASYPNYVTTLSWATVIRGLYWTIIRIPMKQPMERKAVFFFFVAQLSLPETTGVSGWHQVLWSWLAAAFTTPSTTFIILWAQTQGLATKLASIFKNDFFKNGIFTWKKMETGKFRVPFFVARILEGLATETAGTLVTSYLWKCTGERSSAVHGWRDAGDGRETRNQCHGHLAVDY